TSETNANLIHESSIIKGSKWNLQGTEELAHCHFIYFTDLFKINDIFDLLEIGMADKGTTIKLCSDDGKQIEEFEVYREEAGNRTHTLSIWVDPELISPPPLILHEPNTFSGSEYSWWEIFHNSIFRVPVKLNSYLPLKYIGEQEYLLETSESLIPVEGFLAGHGMDMLSMRIILSEPKPENHPRKDNLTNADIGKLDDFWVETWGKNLSVLAAGILLKSLPKSP
ncbi:hypothetical protein ACOHYD_13920, partial [Desulfobacterota bacterium M19]